MALLLVVEGLLPFASPRYWRATLIQLLALRDAGCAVLVVSEELDELFEISDRLVVMAGVPFGVPGSTNVLHVVRLVGDELERYRKAQA